MPEVLKSNKNKSSFLIPSELDLKPFSLSFKDRALEDEYLTKLFNDSYKQVRTLTLAGLALVALFAFLDIILFAKELPIILGIRFTIVFFNLIIWLIPFFSCKFYEKHWQTIVSTMLLIGGLGILAMIIIAPPPVSYFYYAGLILVLMYNFTLLHVRFAYAFFVGFLLVILYSFTIAFFIKVPQEVFINNIFFFVSANLIGVAANYLSELNTRFNFHLLKSLDI